MTEQELLERAERAEALLVTTKESSALALDRVKIFKSNFGVRERSNGEIDVDFEKFAERIGQAGALVLRRIIDERYKISGKPGEKPRMRVVHE